MFYTNSELWGLLNTANAAVKDLQSTLNRSRAKGASLALAHLEEIEKLNAYIEAQKMSGNDAIIRKLAQIVELEDKCKKQEAGLRIMSDTISWMTDNRRIF